MPNVYTAPNSVVSENHATVTGPHSIVTGNFCRITGSDCIVNGNFCIVEGPRCTINGNFCEVSGPNCTVYGNFSKITGTDCKLQQKSSSSSGMTQLNQTSTNFFGTGPKAKRGRKRKASAVNDSNGLVKNLGCVVNEGVQILGLDDYDTKRGENNSQFVVGTGVGKVTIDGDSNITIDDDGVKIESSSSKPLRQVASGFTIKNGCVFNNRVEDRDNDYKIRLEGLQSGNVVRGGTVINTMTIGKNAPPLQMSFNNSEKAKDGPAKKRQKRSITIGGTVSNSAFGTNPTVTFGRGANLGGVVTNTFRRDGSVSTTVNRGYKLHGYNLGANILPGFNMGGGSHSGFNMSGSYFDNCTVHGTKDPNLFKEKVRKLVGDMPVNIKGDFNGIHTNRLDIKISDLIFDESGVLEVTNPITNKLVLISEHGKITVFDAEGAPLSEPPKEKVEKDVVDLTSSPSPSSSSSSSSSISPAPKETIVNSGITTDKTTEKDDDPMTCKICKERLMMMAAMPCGHFYSCITCAKDVAKRAKEALEKKEKDASGLANCAICNQPASSFNLVYLS